MFAALFAPGNLPLISECAGYFSPWIEAAADAVVFDVRGLRLIHGPPAEIAAAIERRMGLKANLAIAPNPDCALHAARGLRGTTVIARGREAETLAPLPLFLLGGSDDFARTLDLWGIRTFGEFAALPPLGIAARLGEEGIAMQRLARGQGSRLLRLPSDPLEFVEEFEPESTLDLLEPLLLILAAVLQTLCKRIAVHSLAINQLRLRLKLERQPDYTLTLDLPVPMLDPQVLLKLLQLELNQQPPAAAVERIRLELQPVAPRVTQQEIFLPVSPEPQKLEITLARIRNLVGAANLGAAELLDTHRPDSFRLGRLKLSGTKLSREKNLLANDSRPRVALRRFRPPAHAQVWLDAAGQPVRLASSCLQGRAQGRILACFGPWHTSGDWWTADPWQREEWDVEIAAGLLRIHQDRRRSEWFVEGTYD